MLGIVSAIGLVVLLAAFAFGLVWNQSRTRREKALTEASAEAKLDGPTERERQH